MQSDSLLPVVRRSITLVSLVATAFFQSTSRAENPPSGFTALFNGKDLQGWHSYLASKPGKAWQVQNGAIFLNKNEKLNLRVDYGFSKDNSGLYVMLKEAF